MVSPTPNLALNRFEVGENVNVALINDNSDKVDAFATDVEPNVAYRVNSDADRLARFPVPAEGNRVWRNDLDAEQYYDGAAWQTNKPGLNKILPATVNGTNVTVDAFGTVTIAAGTDVSLNGVFTARFRNYRVVIEVDHASSSSGIIRLRAAGTDADAAASYGWAYKHGNGATVTGSASNTDALQWAVAAATETRIELEVYNPAVAKQTVFGVFAHYIGATICDSNGTCRHATAGAYDGITLKNLTAVNGRISVYGYA